MSITNYFQITKGASFDLSTKQTIPQTNTICKDFYEKCLKEKMSECKSAICTAEKQRLQSSVASFEATLKQVNWNVERITNTISRKEGIILRMEADKHNHQPIVTEATNMTSTTAMNAAVSNVATILSTVTMSTAATDELLFSKFSDRFDSMELAELRSISKTNDSKSNDSTLVLKILRFLYKNDLDKIESISVSGNSRKGDSKERMSKQNFDTVNDMLAERLRSMKLGPTEYATRMKPVNQHIKNGLSNIVKTKKSRKVDDEETLQKINEQFNSNK